MCDVEADHTERLKPTGQERRVTRMHRRLKPTAGRRVTRKEANETGVNGGEACVCVCGGREDSGGGHWAGNRKHTRGTEHWFLVSHAEHHFVTT